MDGKSKRKERGSDVMAKRRKGEKRWRYWSKYGGRKRR